MKTYLSFVSKKKYSFRISIIYKKGNLSLAIHSILEHINLTQSKHIFTREHPIEYYFKTKKTLFSQYELNTDVASYQE